MKAKYDQNSTHCTSNCIAFHFILLSFVCPRGIVCMMLGNYVMSLLLEKGHASSEFIIPQLVLIILGTVIFSSIVLRFFVEPLGLKTSEEKLLVVGGGPWANLFAQCLKDGGVSVILADSEWERIRMARMMGLDTHFGEVLSDSFEEDMDLLNLAYVVALTPDDHYNRLICSSFMDDLGRENVYQVPFEMKGESVKKTVYGRFLFKDFLTLMELNRKVLIGWKFNTVKVSEKSLEHYKNSLDSKDVIPVLLWKKNGRMVFPGKKDILWDDFDRVLLFQKPS